MSKSDRARAYIRERVLSGKLQSGERIRISSIARELGCSDIPVREGVMKLQAEGLLQFETNRGAVVTKLDPGDITEIFAIQAELEALSVRRAVRAINRDQLDALRDLLEEIEAAEREGRVDERGRLSRDFHFAIYEASPYRRLLALTRGYWDMTDWCRRIFADDADAIRPSAAEHRSIYQALVAGDGEAAAEMLRRHRHRTGAWLLEHAQAGEGGRAHDRGPDQGGIALD